MIEKCWNTRFYEYIKLKNIFIFYDDELDKFVLLIWKGIYPYEFLNNWGKLKEISLPTTEYFCSNLNLKNITKSDYKHAKDSSFACFKSL